MTDDTPFDIARKIRNFGDALAQQDLLAREIDADAQYLNISPVDSADTFFRRQNGAPRCEHQEPDQARRLLCPDDAQFLVTNFSGATVGDAFAQPVTASCMTRAYCQNHAAENAVARHGWLHSTHLESAADNTLRNVLQLQLARRLARNFQSPKPAPYPTPDPFENPDDPGPPSVEKLREIQSRITFLLRSSRLYAAPLCYDADSQRNQQS